MRKLKLTLIFSISFVLLFSGFSFSQPPPSQEMSGEVRTQELERQSQQLRKKVEEKEKVPSIKEELPPPPAPLKSEQKVLVKNINVVGVTLLKEQEIDKIIKPYINQQITVTELQKVANLITDAYRQKGYITSRAYLPPQRIAEGQIEIRVLEGTMGVLEIKGNKYFSTKLLKKMVTLKQGEAFNYDILRRNLVRMNEGTDRYARAVLMPGKEAGSTDVVLEVQDRLPIHAGFSIDDFGSRYIDHQRYLVQFVDNNLLGFDDKLVFQYQLAQSSKYFLKNIRYLFPVNPSLEIGAFASLSRLKLGQEFEDTDARGKSQIYSLFANQTIINDENLNVTVNLGFDYKNIVNYQNQAATSHDRLRVAKIGFNTDYTDNYGRTVFTYEFDYGIPNMWGGMAAQDGNSSRSGAGGKFVKNSINLLRLQKMPFSSNLLWKNQIQLSPYILSAAEQFQLGGIVNVRGYPPAEVVGDSGYSMTWEWSFPFYFIPKQAKVPFSKATFYDALRWVVFYDWGNTRLRRPTAGTEEKNKTLRATGVGIRVNLPEDFSARVEFAWPLDNAPSDGDRLHTWWQVTKDF